MGGPCNHADPSECEGFIMCGSDDMLLADYTTRALYPQEFTTALDIWGVDGILNVYCKYPHHIYILSLFELYRYFWHLTSFKDCRVLE